MFIGNSQYNIRVEHRRPWKHSLAATARWVDKSKFLRYIAGFDIIVMISYRIGIFRGSQSTRRSYGALTNFTHFPEASNVIDTAGMNKQRLQTPHNADYLKWHTTNMN